MNVHRCFDMSTHIGLLVFCAQLYPGRQRVGIMGKLINHGASPVLHPEAHTFSHVKVGLLEMILS